MATGSRGSLEARNVRVDPNASRERVKGEFVDWNDQKGFGFIKIDDGEEIFVHCQDVRDGDTLRRGDRVEFQVNVEPKSKRTRAVRVVKIDDERASSVEAESSIEHEVETTIDENDSLEERIKGECVKWVFRKN